MSAKEKSKDNSDGGAPEAPAYMVLYGSLMILLMTFFIVLVTMSSVKESGELASELGTLREAFGVVQGNNPGVLPGEEKAIDKGDSLLQICPDYYSREGGTELASSVEQFLREAETKGLQDIKVTYLDRGVSMTLPEAILFDVGRAELKPGALKVLDKILFLFKDKAYDVRVEGHTDNLAIHTRKFPSNWELSAARAISVIKYFHRAGYIDYKRLSAIGYGEYRPIVANRTEEGRKNNRRVEIIIREGGEQNG